MTTQITVQITVHKPIEKVWESFTEPKHIVQWNHASDDWHCPTAENDLKVGGRFVSRMESVDGGEGFDFSGIYTEIVLYKLIAYTMEGEGQRAVREVFETVADGTQLTITFDAEDENPIEMQKGGWQAILENFRDYTEKLD